MGIRHLRDFITTAEAGGLSQALGICTSFRQP